MCIGFNSCSWLAFETTWSCSQCLLTWRSSWKSVYERSLQVTTRAAPFRSIVQSKASMVWSKPLGNGTQVFIFSYCVGFTAFLVYVDDIIDSGTDFDSIHSLQTFFSDKFRILSHLVTSITFLVLKWHGQTKEFSFVKASMHLTFLLI